MSRKRLSAADRRATILAGARRAFALHGLKASSLQIAAEAQISDALIFRHFPNKDALHRAVLRNLIEEQDQIYAQVGLTLAGAEGLMVMLEAYFRACLEPEPDHVERVRILAANLASEGDYAKLAYRRAVRVSRPALAQAIAEARAAGHLTGAEVAVENIVMFLEHLGSTVTLATAGKGGDVGAYAGGTDKRLADLVRFAGRGLGLKDEVLNEYLESHAL